MEFRILGPVEVEVDGTPIAVAPKERLLLAVLVVSAGEVVPVSRLIHELWESDPPADARNAVQLLMSRLRKALGPHSRDLVITQRPGYVLQARSDEVDARRFEALLRRARQVRPQRPAEASLLLDEALQLWRGPALAGLADHDFARLEGGRLDELRVVAAEEKIAADLELGHHDEIVPRVRELVEQHPLRERLHSLLMLALYRAGRQSEALDAFHAARRLLADELGVDPGAQLQQLHERILRHDPELASATTAGTPRPVHHLPLRLTSFVGRDVEQQVVRKLLSTHRLVTVVGAGGVGKTSFAVEVARQVQPRFPDGAWFVDLSAQRNGSFVARAVAEALGLATDAGAGRTTSTGHSACASCSAIAASCSCWTTASTSSKPAPPRRRGCCAHARTCGCWRPAASDLGSPPRRPGRCRLSGCRTTLRPGRTCGPRRLFGCSPTAPQPHAASSR